MSEFTIKRINQEIASLETVYEYLKSKMTLDPSAFELATVIFSTICTLKSSIEYEESIKPENLKLPFQTTKEIAYA